MPAIGKVFPDNDDLYLEDQVAQLMASKNRLALSLKDVDRMVPEVRRRMLDGKLDLTQLLRVGDKQDVPAVAFSCDLLTAATICDIIRSEDRKVGDSPTGIWLLRKTWSRVSGDKVLTGVDGGKVHLNPAVFCVEVEAVAPVAPPRVRV